MIIKITVTYRDETKETFECIDYPNVQGDWTVIYLKDLERNYIPSQTIQKINLKLK